MTSIKADINLHDRYIDPQFRFFFGSSKWNRENFDDIIKLGKDTYIHHIDDDFTTSSFDSQGFLPSSGLKNEAVWAIVVNGSKKKITVVFRGSVNIKDWMSNIKVNMTDLKLPGYTKKDSEKDSTVHTSDTGDLKSPGNIPDIDDSKRDSKKDSTGLTADIDDSKKDSQKDSTNKLYGRVHCGFYHYLFDGTNKMNGSSMSKGVSKGEEIIDMLKEQFFSQPNYKDYKLEVTGHSLGGALSTMFAFRAATEEDLPKVTNVSFASPFVGDSVFREEFMKLEKEGKIRHLRISNYQDVVTLIPSTSLPGFPIPTIESYKHVGINIRLYEGGSLLTPSYRRFYPKEGSKADGIRNTLHSSVVVGIAANSIGNHLCPEYDDRLSNEKTKADLSNITLEGLYTNTNITGWIPDEKKEPEKTNIPTPSNGSVSFKNVDNNEVTDTKPAIFLPSR